MRTHRTAPAILTASLVLGPLAAMAQVKPPQFGPSLAIGVGTGWTSNPDDLPNARRGDALATFEITAAYRLALWKDAALAASLGTDSEIYPRRTTGGVHKLVGGLTLSQRWEGFNFSLSAGGRTVGNQDLSRHDSAYREVSLSVNRPIEISKGLSLIPTVSGARRFYSDGSEDQWRARFNLALVHSHDKWTFRIFGGLGWALEDKTTLYPRINDRSFSVGTGASYEFQKDREVGLRISYGRTYSSYSENRTKTFSFRPSLSTTFRF